MSNFNRSLWSKLVQSLRLLRKAPKLGDVFASPDVPSRRRYHRHLLEDQDIAFAIVQDTSYSVVDIGYGGLRLAMSNIFDFMVKNQVGHTLDLTLTMLGLHYDLRARLLKCEEGVASFNFEGLNQIDEGFLASFLFFMDAGIKLKAIPKHSISSHYRGHDWLSYGSATRSIEVHLKKDDEGDMTEAHVFYLNGFKQDYALFNHKGVAVASQPRRNLSSRDKREILIRSLCILIGLKQIGRTKRLNRVIDHGLRKLSRTKKFDAA